MVIDMNESKLETIEQIREFLTGTAAVTFSIPAGESTLRAFVATVIRRFGYFSRSKGQRGGACFHAELGIDELVAEQRGHGRIVSARSAPCPFGAVKDRGRMSEKSH
jgi:hypothetical protein